MGATASPEKQKLSEEKELERQHLEKMNLQYKKIFENILLELYDMKEHFPNTIFIEKEKCGRPTYVSNSTLSLYCPKCGGGVQKFIENKLIKIMKIQNKIYPLYSNYICADTKCSTVVPNIEVKSEENGKKYFEIYKKKYYFTSDAELYWRDSNSQDPYFYFELVLKEFGFTKHHEEAKSLEGYSGYNLYRYENPLRNHDVKEVMIYYRCIKCYLEYHLYTPHYLYYLRTLFLKEKEKENAENDKNINVDNEKKEEEKKENNNAAYEKEKENPEKK